MNVLFRLVGEEMKSILKINVFSFALDVGKGGKVAFICKGKFLCLVIKLQ